MIVIEIESMATSQKSGTNSKGPWTMNFQQIVISGHYVDGFASRHPRESTIQLDEKSPAPYPVGKYVISAESFYFGDFGRFTLGRLKLQPLAQFMTELQEQFKGQQLKAAA